MSSFKDSLRMFLWMTILTGFLYPLLITAIGQLTMNHKANGGAIIFQEKIVGAELIGQKFTSAKYFWGRPSAVDNNPLPSGGSNLGPTSKDLKKAIEDRKKSILQGGFTSETSSIPAELLYASGSGLDPHIRPDTARFQVDRIATARDLDEQSKKQVYDLIDKLTTISPFSGRYLNVLQLNIALDKLTKPKQEKS